MFDGLAKLHDMKPEFLAERDDFDLALGPAPLLLVSNDLCSRAPLKESAILVVSDRNHLWQTNAIRGVRYVNLALERSRLALFGHVAQHFCPVALSSFVFEDMPVHQCVANAVEGFGFRLSVWEIANRIDVHSSTLRRWMLAEGSMTTERFLLWLRAIMLVRKFQAQRRTPPPTTLRADVADPVELRRLLRRLGLPLSLLHADTDASDSILRRLRKEIAGDGDAPRKAVRALG